MNALTTVQIQARAQQVRRRRAQTSARAGVPCAAFIREYIQIDNAQPGADDGATMPFLLWPAQETLLGEMQAERLLLILKARQLGISWLACAYALWLCLYHPGRLVLMFSIGQSEANEMKRRVSVMYWRLPDALRAGLPTLTKENTEEMAWSNGSRIQSLPARRTAGSGYTASLVIMDEFAKNERAREIYTAVKPTIDGGGKMIILSTAHGAGNLFHELVEKARRGDGRFAFSFLDWQARPGRDAAWYAAVASDAVDDAAMKQEYPATPDEAFEASEIGSFLPSITLWDACREELPPLDKHTPCVLALDAGESNDTFATVIVSRHPTNPARLAVRYARAYVPQGEPLNFDAIEDDLRTLVSVYAIQQIAYDPMLLGQTIRRLTSAPRAIAAPCEPFPQGAARLEADKGLLDLITQRRIAHDGTLDDLRAHLANANKAVDKEGRRLRIVKRKYSLKIDLAVCLSMSCARASTLDVTDGFSIAYDNRRNR